MYENDQNRKFTSKKNKDDIVTISDLDWQQLSLSKKFIMALEEWTHTEGWTLHTLQVYKLLNTQRIF